MTNVYFLYDCNIEGQQYFTTNIKQRTFSFPVGPLKIVIFLRLFIFKETALMQLLFCWMLIENNPLLDADREQQYSPREAGG